MIRPYAGRTALRERPDLLMLHRFGSLERSIPVARGVLPRPAWWQAMWGVGPVGGTGVRRSTEGISDVDNQVSVTRGELAHRQMGPEGDNHG